MLPVTWPGVSWRLPGALGPHVSNDLQPSTTHFLSSPASGRWPQWDHQRGSASRRLDGAVEGLRAGLACSRSHLAVLNHDLFSMSWHTPRVPFLASPLASVRPCMPGTLCHFAPSGLVASCSVGTIVSNDLLSVRACGPGTRFSMRLSTRAGSPVGGAPIYTTACCAGPDFSRVASTSTKA